MLRTTLCACFLNNRIHAVRDGTIREIDSESLSDTQSIIFFQLLAPRPRSVEYLTKSDGPLGIASVASEVIDRVVCLPAVEKRRSSLRGKNELHLLPNVKDQPHVCLARAVRKHGT